MASKDLCMWELVACSTGRLSMAMGLRLYPAFLRLLHLAHGVGAVAAVALRKVLRMNLKFTETQNGRTLMLRFLTSEKLIVSGLGVTIFC